MTKDASSLDMLEEMTEQQKAHWFEVNGLEYAPGVLDVAAQAALDDGADDANIISSFILAILDMKGVRLERGEGDL